MKKKKIPRMKTPKKSDIRRKFDRKSYLEREEEELKDRPSISPYSKKLALKRNNNVPLYMRYEKELKMKETRQLQLKNMLDHRKILQEEMDLTFKPKTNLSETIVSTTSFKVDNLEEHERKRQRKLSHLKRRYLIEESKELTFTPKINSKSQRLVKNANLGQRFQRYQEKRQEKMSNIEREVSRERLPFKPDLSKSKRSLSMTRRSYNSDFPHLLKATKSPKISNKSKIDQMKSMIKKNNVRKSPIRQDYHDYRKVGMYTQQEGNNEFFDKIGSEDLLDGIYESISHVEHREPGDLLLSKKPYEKTNKSNIFNSRCRRRTDHLNDLDFVDDSFNEYNKYLNSKKLKPKIYYHKF